MRKPPNFLINPGCYVHSIVVVCAYGVYSRGEGVILTILLIWILHLCSYQDSISKDLLSATLIWNVKSLFIKLKDLTLNLFNKLILFVLLLSPGGVLGGVCKRESQSNIHHIHIMQDSTITVATNTHSCYVVKKFATVFRIKRSGKCLSVFLFRSFQEISCLNEVLFFGKKEITLLTLC